MLTSGLVNNSNIRHVAWAIDDVVRYTELN